MSVVLLDLFLDFILESFWVTDVAFFRLIQELDEAKFLEGLPFGIIGVYSNSIVEFVISNVHQFGFKLEAKTACCVIDD